MPSVVHAAYRTASSESRGVDLAPGGRRPRPTASPTAAPTPTHDDPQTGLTAAGRQRPAGDEADGRNALSSDRSGRYLVAASIFTIVALTGAVLSFATRHDVAGTVLLLLGDALVIATWVDYLRRP